MTCYTDCLPRSSEALGLLRDSWHCVPCQTCYRFVIFALKRVCRHVTEIAVDQQSLIQSVRE